MVSIFKPLDLQIFKSSYKFNLRGVLVYIYIYIYIHIYVYTMYCHCKYIGCRCLEGAGGNDSLDLGLCLDSLSLEQTSTKFVLNAMSKVFQSVSMSMSVSMLMSLMDSEESTNEGGNTIASRPQGSNTFTRQRIWPRSWKQSRIPSTTCLQALCCAY